MRLIGAVLLIGMSVQSVLAQTSELESQIQKAFETLRNSSSLMLRLDGEQKLPKRTLKIAASLYWHRTSEAAKVELCVWRDEKQIARLVGDNTTFWVLDMSKNEYSTVAYNGDANKLISALTAASESFCAYPSRILREVYGGDFAWFREWLPGATCRKDALNFVCESKAPVDKKLTFLFSKSGGPLESLKYFEKLKTGERSTEWTMSVFGDFIPAQDNFIFVPPQDSRAVVAQPPP